MKEKKLIRLSWEKNEHSPFTTSAFCKIPVCLLGVNAKFIQHKKISIILLYHVLLVPISDFFFFLIGIHPMQGWTATTSHGVKRKKKQKILQDTDHRSKENIL